METIEGQSQPIIRAIVADDSEPMRESLVKLLRTFPGLSVLSTARDGREAVRQTEQALPDLVILDYRMPRMDGFAAARAIKERFPETRVIIVSMHDLESYRDESSAIGVDAVLRKTELRTRLGPLLEQLFALPFDSRDV